MKITILLSFILASLSAPWAWSQDGDMEELNLIEMELDKSNRAVMDEETETVQAVRPSPDSKSTPDVTYEDLSRLSEFKQVSVIQKRYLPRTGRIQAYLGPAFTLNDPWFNVMGASLKLGYNFTEAWGVEVNYSTMSTESTKALKELKKENGITTENFVYTKSYYTVGANWTPLYGKMTWLNERIVYYDIYFTVGFGGTTIQNNDVQDTFNVGAGQIFSITKGRAFRWDISWNFFDAKQVDSTQGTYNNVILSAGFSFFFPEAQYR